ncbi:dynein regulatory complex subunit 3-like [Diaphorina citri]|uniref:Dynein axonemal assembly factor 1 homolog n=1 Tax=Diaphorina citri TaxID=121845 RepID=A0A1S3D9G5_DIACI|nr:dynein regulatory complex subunit 3-like [Diaphorina citri]
MDIPTTVDRIKKIGLIKDRAGDESTLKNLAQVLQNAPAIINEDLLSKKGVISENLLSLLQESTNLAEKLQIYKLIKAVNLRIKTLRKIENLWMMENLVELDLSMNHIGVIENLDQLVCLEKLDLGYNRIEQIQGLDTLVNLKVLNLKMNRIETIEGLDHLEKLELFNIAANRIQSLASLVYLRRFKHLGRLNIERNPVCDKENVDGFAIAMVPQLQCYNNHIILEDERRTALEQHMYDVRTETLKDLMVQRERQNALASQRKSEEKSKAFVENLEGDFLFNVQFENDVEGQEMLKLCTIPTKLGRSVAELYNNFKRDFLEVSSKLYEFGTSQHSLRQNEVDEFQAVYRALKLKSCHEVRALLNQCWEKKIRVTKKIMTVAHRMEKIASKYESGGVLDERLERMRNSIQNVALDHLDDEVSEIVGFLQKLKKRTLHLASNQTLSDYAEIMDNQMRSDKGHSKSKEQLQIQSKGYSKSKEQLQIKSKGHSKSKERATKGSVARQKSSVSQDAKDGALVQDDEVVMILDVLLSFKQRKLQIQTENVGKLTFVTEFSDVAQGAREDHIQRSKTSLHNTLSHHSLEENQLRPEHEDGANKGDGSIVIDVKKEVGNNVDIMILDVKNQIVQLHRHFEGVAKSIFFQEYRQHRNLLHFLKTFKENMKDIDFNFVVEIVSNFELLRKHSTSFNTELGKLLRAHYKVSVS